MIYNVFILALIKMMILAPPPIRLVHGCKNPRWKIVLTSSGNKIIEAMNPPSPLPTELNNISNDMMFPVVTINHRDWKKLRRKELYVPRNKSRPPIGGINGKGFGARH